MNTELIDQAPIGLQKEAEVVFSWARGLGVGVDGVTKLIKCFDKDYLLSLPRPKSKYKRGTFTVEQNCGHLWYRTAANIFGWRDRPTSTAA